MMTEFDLGDYAEARRLASEIKKNADNINSIFSKMNGLMARVAVDWQGEGSRQVQDAYEDIKAKYPAFYQKLIDYSEHILSVTATDEEAEDAAAKAFQNAG